MHDIIKLTQLSKSIQNQKNNLTIYISYQLYHYDNKITAMTTRNHSVQHTRNSLNTSIYKSHFSTMNTTMNTTTMNMSQDVKSNLIDKWKTMSRWKYPQSGQKIRKIRQNPLISTKTNSNDIMKSLLMLVQKNIKTKKKNQVIIQQLESVKQQRRERFKKSDNPSHIIQSYMAKQGYKPTEQQNQLLNKIIKLKDIIDTVQPLDLTIILPKLYDIMNLAVDRNQMKFLIAIVVLTGDLCYQMKDMVRAIHFFTQAITAATCVGMNKIKVDCFIKLGFICLDRIQQHFALLFFKKALQYAWKTKNHESQLQIYDYIGKCFYSQGETKLAEYYHKRSIQGETQLQNSAMRRISYEMLNQFDKTVVNKERKNISRLFIQYLDLPIKGFNYIKPPKGNKVYPNYIDDSSPRKDKEPRSFQTENFLSVQKQLHQIFNNTPQFQTELPNPDLQRNFVAMKKFGKARKQFEFEQSNQYHKLTGVKITKLDKSLLKLDLDDRVNHILSEKPNPDWWEQIVTNTKMKQHQKLGSLRSRIWNTHKSHQKYPEQRKRATSLKYEKVKQSLNITILDLIDPPKH